MTTPGDTHGHRVGRREGTRLQLQRGSPEVAREGLSHSAMEGRSGGQSGAITLFPQPLNSGMFAFLEHSKDSSRDAGCLDLPTSLDL